MIIIEIGVWLFWIMVCLVLGTLIALREVVDFVGALIIRIAKTLGLTPSS